MTLKSLKIAEREVADEDEFNQIVNSITPCGVYFPGEFNQIVSNFTILSRKKLIIHYQKCLLLVGINQ